MGASPKDDLIELLADRDWVAPRWAQMESALRAVGLEPGPESLEVWNLPHDGAPPGLLPWRSVVTYHPVPVTRIWFPYVKASPRPEVGKVWSDLPPADWGTRPTEKEAATHALVAQALAAVSVEGVAPGLAEYVSLQCLADSAQPAELCDKYASYLSALLAFESGSAERDYFIKRLKFHWKASDSMQRPADGDGLLPADAAWLVAETEAAMASPNRDEQS